MNANQNVHLVHTPAPTDAETPRPRRSRRPWIVGAVAVAAGIGGTACLLAPRTHESTDDAYLKADETTVSSQIRGRVAEVLVHDNQAVRAGDVLLRIQPEEFDARLALAAAEQKTAEANVTSAKAALATLDAERRVAHASSQVVAAGLRSALAQSVRAEIDEKRYTHLAETGAASRRDAEVSRTTALAARADADRTEAALTTSREQEALVNAKRAGALAAMAQAQAALARAKAIWELARQDQSHATIRAAVDGTVGALQTRVGDYVQPGSKLMTIVPLHGLYAVAYFKETQTARMLPGQHAELELDALSGTKLAGTVDSLAPGTGSAFSFLPFEPGTGNFTKIVQRVPVRIRLDGAPAVVASLRAGLSAAVTVDLSR